MAKRKGVRHTNPPLTNQAWRTMIPDVRGHFLSEIEQMLTDVPDSLWNNQNICGLAYDFLPWHQHSLVSIQSRGESPSDKCILLNST